MLGIAWLCDPAFEEKATELHRNLFRADLAPAVQNELGSSLGEFLFSPQERLLNRLWLEVPSSRTLPHSVGERALIFTNRLYWRLEQLGLTEVLAIPANRRES